MAQRARTTVTFAASRVIQPISTRGNVAVSQDGRILASCLDEDVLLTDLTSSAELARIEGDGEIATSISLTPDAAYLIICSRSLSMRIYALSPNRVDDKIDVEVLRTLKPHTTPVVVSAVDKTGSLLATGGADGVVKVWDIRGGFVTHTFHGHSGVISALHFFELDAEIAREEASKKRKRKSKGEDQAFHDQVNGDATLGYRLASGGEDGKVRIWNLHTRSSAATLDAHVSVVRALRFSPDEGMFLSASRDKTVVVWDCKSWKARKTVAVLEEVESAGFLSNGKLFYTGGETARLRVWSTGNGRELTEEQAHGTETDAIQEVLHYPEWEYLITAHADQTLVLRSLTHIAGLTSDSIPSAISALPVIRTIAGSHGQIIDVAYVGDEKNLLALATNSEDVRIISIKDAQSSRAQDGQSNGGRHVQSDGGDDGQSDNDADGQQSAAYFGSDVALLKGHEDIVIAMDIDWSGHWLATGAKDNTARMWRLDPANHSYEPWATFTGHAESVGAVGLARSTPPEGSTAQKAPLDHPPSFLITGSQDQTVKKWDVRKDNAAVRSAYTRKAHDKDINAIAVHPSSQLFASASQDRTVKIWSVEDGSTVGVLKGHKRGVWTVAFSNPGTNLQIPGASGGSRGFILTGSGDKTVRIWSLVDYSCLMTMEGHTNSVLKVVWLPPSTGATPLTLEDEMDVDRVEPVQPTTGPLVASSGADGLVKVWDAQSGECAATLDNHTDRVWALTTRPAGQSKGNGIGESLISGAGDGVLTFWVDTTASTALALRARESKQVELQQELENHVFSQNWREAIVLALQLDQPFRLLTLFKNVVESEKFEQGSWTGLREVDEVIASLGEEQVLKLLKRCREWNTNARQFLVGQRVLRAVIEAFGVDRLAEMGSRRVKRVVDGEENRDGVGMKKGSVGGEKMKEVVHGLRAYGERHFGRVSEMWDESFVVEFTLGEMDEVLAGGMSI